METETDYTYDPAIDQVNWLSVFLGFFAFYIFVGALARTKAPPPGDIKAFKERKRIKEYYFYYH